MKELKIVVADDNQEKLISLKQLIESNSSMILAGVAKDGEETFRVILETKPDIVLLDLVMPKMDGLTVVEQVQKAMQEEDSPAFIVVTRIYNEYIQECGINLGVVYYIVKPYSNEVLMNRIKQIGESRQRRKQKRIMENLKSSIGNKEGTIGQEELREYVTALLQEIPVPAHLKGYYYLRDGIIMCVNDMNMLNGVTKVLYPTIAKSYGTSGDGVERAIRNAISVAMKRGSMEIINELLGYNMRREDKISNSEFIAVLSDKIRMEIKK